MEGDETGLEQKVRHWLQVSGKKSELQAKLRAELYGAIQTEIAFRGDISITGEVERRSVSHREKIINWMVSQHLTSNSHWLTNSVFVRYWSHLKLTHVIYTHCFSETYQEYVVLLCMYLLYFMFLKDFETKFCSDLIVMSGEKRRCI